MVYLIMSGEYSDKAVHGYMLDKVQAEKYCAKINTINQKCAKQVNVAEDYDTEISKDGFYDDEFYNDFDIYDDLYVVGIDELSKRNLDTSDIELRYYHTILFDFETGMRYEPNRYRFYTGTKKKPKACYSDKGKWICFQFDCENRKLAEKIAQDKYAMFMSLYHLETGSYDYAAQSMGVSKYDPFAEQ